MEDSNFSRRRSHGHQKAMRGNPEGDSLYSHRQKFRAPASARRSNNNVSTDSGVSSMKRRKQNHHDDYRIPEKKKHRRTYSDSDLSTLDMTDTPDSLSQISAIAPVSELSIATTFSQIKPHKFKPDTTWENAVSHARGEPDGAEKSFHKKKSKVSMQEMLAPVPEDASLHSSHSGGNASSHSRASAHSQKEQENIPDIANAPNTVERKKSIKVCPC